MSPTISTLPFHAPIDDFLGFRFGGTSAATTRPRLVTVMVLPFTSTSSSRARHFALNSVALTTWFFISSGYHLANWSSDHIGAHTSTGHWLASSVAQAWK